MILTKLILMWNGRIEFHYDSPQYLGNYREMLEGISRLRHMHESWGEVLLL